MACLSLFCYLLQIGAFFFYFASGKQPASGIAVCHSLLVMVFTFLRDGRTGSSRGVSPGPWRPQVLAHLAHRPLLCVWVGSAVETEQVVKLVGARGCSGLGLSAPAPSDERNMTPLLLPWDLLVRDVFFLFFLPSPRTRAVRGGWSLSLGRADRRAGPCCLLLRVCLVGDEMPLKPGGWPSLRIGAAS